MSETFDTARTRSAIDHLFYTVATELTDAALGTPNASPPVPSPAPLTPSMKIAEFSSPVSGTTLRVDRGHVFRATGQEGLPKSPVGPAVESAGSALKVSPAINQDVTAELPRQSELAHRVQPGRQVDLPRLRRAGMGNQTSSNEVESLLENLRQQLVDLGERISDQLSDNNAIYSSFEHACRLFHELKSVLSAQASSGLRAANSQLIESGR